ncbi:Uncharacterized protein APZ42_001883, partial [Daphnia magna]
MVKAFKHSRSNHVQEVIDSVVANNTEQNVVTEAVHQENLFSDSSDVEADVENVNDLSFNEENSRENPTPENMTPITAENSNALDVGDSTRFDISDTTSEIEMENEEVEFLQFERQASESLRTMFFRNEGETEEQYLKRLSCFSHRLQLVMAIFDKFRIYNARLPQIGSTHRLPVFATVISKARKLVSRFNTSSVATPLLISLSGRKLLTDVSTRWSSNYFVMDCLYQLRKPVSQVCQELGWDELSNSEWIML